MEQQLKSQYAWYNQMDSCINNYKKKGQAMTLAYAETKLETLKDCWNKIFESHHKILLLSSGETQTNNYFDSYDKYEEVYHTARASMQETIDSFRAPIRVDANQSLPLLNSTNAAPIQEHIRLPSIPLPKFSGDYSTWTSYRDQFTSMICENERLSPVQKLHYLKASLSGEAESLLKHVQVTDANFVPAWKTLNDRYENKRVLINAQLKHLLSQPSLTSESANGVKRLLDTTNDCMHQLTNLGINLETWDCILIYLTTQKLTIESQQLWEQTCQNVNDLPKMSDLIKFLSARFRILEVTGILKPKQSFSQSTIHKDKRPNTFNQPQSFHTSNVEHCPVCASDHRIYKCPKFSEWTHESKFDMVKKNGLCINCLSHGHLSSSCTSKRSCWVCQKRHHTLLHIDTKSNSSNRTFGDSTSSSTPHSTRTAISNPPKTFTTIADIHPAPINNFHVEKTPFNQNVLLATAIVTIVAPNGLHVTARALLDQGSEACFVTEAIVQQLNIRKSKSSTNVIGLGESLTGTTKGKVHLTIQSRNYKVSDICFEAFVLPKITNLLPSNRIPIQEWKHLENIELADPYYYQSSKIDLLLGANIYAAILQSGLRKGKRGTPIAQKTDLGWILSGTTTSIHPHRSTNVIRNQTSLVSMYNTLDLDRQIRRFWELEEVHSFNRNFTKEEKMCERHYNETVTRGSNGQFIVRLPFDPKYNRYHGKSRDTAVSRLVQLERRLERNPKLHEEYSRTIQEYLELGHMEPVSSSEASNTVIQNKEMYYTVNYLPHHAVIKESSTSTKVRVVFDASQKTSNGKSLNDLLLTGPTIQDDLISIMLRWRKHRFAFTADIQKMYRQIQVATEDMDHQRIVWRKNKHDVIEDFRLKTVTFGTTSAPYLAIKTLQWLATESQTLYPIAAEATMNDFYVDDILSGADTVSEVCEKRDQLLNLLSSGGFQLRKWSSNNRALLAALPDDYLEINLPFNLNRENEIKALGINWHPVRDVFTYHITLEPYQYSSTKRSILSDIAKLFDPLGWITPTIILAKLQIQQLWLSGLDWDEEVPPAINRIWTEYRQQLGNLEQIQISRWIHTRIGQCPIQIHGFCDASQQAYAAAVYIRCADEKGKIKVNLLTAKSKVAPLKSLSLPRLELNGALLLAKLMKKVMTTMKIDNMEMFAWTDSTITLAWIQGHPNKWTTFVANRVAEIQELTNPETWNHVSTKDNPADCASRGIMPNELKAHPLWWTGPHWLYHPKEQWPIKDVQPVTDMELKNITTFNTILTSNLLENLLLKYSKIDTLINVTGYCFRFYNHCKNKENTKQIWLSTDERKISIEFWIKFVQSSCFSKEITELKQSKIVHPGSRIRNLNPFVDGKDILRVGGRLKHSTLNYNEKHPIILPNKNHFTNLIIQNTHIRTCHGGPQLMMATLLKQFWIIDCRNNIRHQIFKCMPCFRQKAQAAKQLMGDLPKERITMSRPFLNTGIDYAGPIDLKVSKGRSPKTTKAYIAVFICLSVKAIHLELVSDLTTDAFLAAFRRFVARRGSVKNMFSDNGTTFVGAKNELNKQLQQFISSTTPEIAAILSKQNVTWHFIPPATPHFGGLWEAGVKSMKTHLKKAVGNTKLTYEEMSTILIQIEGCLNSRPLCPITNDMNDFTALTPGHFLIGDTLLAPPEPIIIDINQHKLSRWQYLQQIQQHYWSKWSAEYLNRLQQRPKWLNKTENVKIGALVLIKSEKTPPTNWLLARIIDVHKGTDDLIRVVTLKTKDTVLTRPITKICLLPSEDIINKI